MKKTYLAGAILFAGSLLLAAFINPRAFGQGALLPPPGPPTPTMKSLKQVEPRTIVNEANTPGDATNSFIISASGSYYLTFNVTGTSGKHGISIQANDVTLDLNGFALISGGGAGVRGVNVPVAQSGFSISNGSVRGWAGGGVRADTAVTLAEKLRLSDNAGATGLAVGNGSMIKDCVASGNARGFFAPDRTQVSNCIATVNTGVGFECENFVTIIDCTSSRNGGNGIVVQATCSVIRCNASRNIPLGGGGGGYGIIAGAGCTIADCTAGANAADGISLAGSGSTVRGCTARANESRGISASNADGCQITGNTCDANQGIGISVDGNLPTRNRIDGNSCTSNLNVGFVINGDRNLVIRNSARGNGGTNYAFATGNVTGPVVDMSGGGTITSTSPWANFSH